MAVRELEEIREQVMALAAALREYLAELPGIIVQDKDAVRCGIVTFTKGGKDAAGVQRRLCARGINASVPYQ